MIYITGDTHGNVARIVECGKHLKLSERDMLLIAGDFGCIFGFDAVDEAKLDILKDQSFTILFIDGNHECFPKLNSYPEERWNGGKVHRVRRNVLHLMRGQVFNIDGISVFTMGGGCSIDKAYRTPGRSWWPEEMPSTGEYEEAWKNLHEHNNHVDVIVSHAAPDETMQMFEQTGVIAQRYPYELKLNLFLENVRQLVQHTHFYFGHMHIDKCLFRNQIALYYDVYRLETGEKVDPMLEVPING